MITTDDIAMHLTCGIHCTKDSNITYCRMAITQISNSIITLAKVKNNMLLTNPEADVTVQNHGITKLKGYRTDYVNYMFTIEETITLLKNKLKWILRREALSGYMVAVKNSASIEEAIDLLFNCCDEIQPLVDLVKKLTLKYQLNPIEQPSIN